MGTTAAVLVAECPTVDLLLFVCEWRKVASSVAVIVGFVSGCWFLLFLFRLTFVSDAAAVDLQTGDLSIPPKQVVF